MDRRRLLLGAPLAAVTVGGAAFWAILRRMDSGRYDPYGIDNPLVGHTMPASTPPMPPGPILVNFFASWCIPCRQEMQTLLQLQTKGISICGVAYKDSDAKVAAFLHTAGNPYRTILWDHDGRLAIDWGVSGVPETYLVDRDLTVRARWVGDLQTDAVLTAIGKLTVAKP